MLLSGKRRNWSWEGGSKVQKIQQNYPVTRSGKRSNCYGWAQSKPGNLELVLGVTGSHIRTEKWVPKKNVPAQTELTTGGGRMGGVPAQTQLTTGRGRGVVPAQTKLMTGGGGGQFYDLFIPLCVYIINNTILFLIFVPAPPPP